MRLFMVTIMTVILSGCSLLPRITFDKPTVVPQKIEKSQKSLKCRGEAILDASGQILSCSDYLTTNESRYNQVERKLTLKERLLNFMSNLVGWGFWIFVALVIFAPGVVGWVFGRLIEGTTGVAAQSTRTLVRAISKAKRNGGNYMEELRQEQAKSQRVRNYVNKLRAEVD